jgi:hypothetical protein
MVSRVSLRTSFQANEEATKHGWCQAELASNKAMREEKTDQVARRSWRVLRRVFEVVAINHEL